MTAATDIGVNSLQLRRTAAAAAPCLATIPEDCVLEATTPEPISLELSPIGEEAEDEGEVAGQVCQDKQEHLSARLAIGCGKLVQIASNPLSPSPAETMTLKAPAPSSPATSTATTTTTPAALAPAPLGLALHFAPAPLAMSAADEDLLNTSSTASSIPRTPSTPSLFERRRKLPPRLAVELPVAVVNDEDLTEEIFTDEFLDTLFLAGIQRAPAATSVSGAAAAAAAAAAAITITAPSPVAFASSPVAFTSAPAASFFVSTPTAPTSPFGSPSRFLAAPKARNSAKASSPLASPTALSTPSHKIPRVGSDSARLRPHSHHHSHHSHHSHMSPQVRRAVRLRRDSGASPSQFVLDEPEKVPALYNTSLPDFAASAGPKKPEAIAPPTSAAAAPPAPTSAASTFKKLDATTQAFLASLLASSSTTTTSASSLPAGAATTTLAAAPALGALTNSLGALSVDSPQQQQQQQQQQSGGSFSAAAASWLRTCLRVGEAKSSKAQPPHSLIATRLHSQKQRPMSPRRHLHTRYSFLT